MGHGLRQCGGTHLVTEPKQPLKGNGRAYSEEKGQPDILPWEPVSNPAHRPAYRSPSHVGTNTGRTRDRGRVGESMAETLTDPIDPFFCAYCLESSGSDELPQECPHCHVGVCEDCGTRVKVGAKLCHGCGRITLTIRANMYRASSYGGFYATQNWAWDGLGYGKNALYGTACGWDSVEEMESGKAATFSLIKYQRSGERETVRLLTEEEAVAAGYRPSGSKGQWRQADQGQEISPVKQSGGAQAAQRGSLLTTGLPLSTEASGAGNQPREGERVIESEEAWNTVRDKVRGFASLEEGWDSYGGDAIRPTAIQNALAFLDRLEAMARELGCLHRVPFAAPCSDGSIDVEWELIGEFK